MKKGLLLAFAACLGLAATPAAAQWTTNTQVNTVVQDAMGTSEIVPLIALLPDGSSYVSWFESAPTVRYRVRLQHLDRNGNKLWGADGLLISGTNPNTSAVYDYDLKVDQAGNALLAFQDLRSGGNYLQTVIYKISPAGVQLWGTNGIQLLDPTAREGLAPNICVTNSNNVVVAWSASSSSSDWVAFQKFSPAGTALWSSVQRIQGTSEDYDRPTPLPAGTDDVLMPYVRTSSSGAALLFAQRFGTTGAAVWSTPTQVSTKNVAFSFFPQPIPDGNDGYFVAIASGNPANANISDVYVQHVSSTGTTWDPVGTEAFTGTSPRFDGRLQYAAARNELWLALDVRDAAQTQSGLSLQKLDPATGAALLGGAGVQVSALSTARPQPIALHDTGTGLIITYREATSSTTNVLKATKLSYTGAPAWPAGPLTVAGASSTKSQPATSAFRNDQYIVTWQDNRQDAGVYVQNVNTAGQAGVITATAAARPTQQLQLYPNPAAVATLHLALPQAEALTVTVQDMVGREVKRLTLKPVAGASTVTLEAPELAAGVYLVRTTVAGQALSGRWVKE